MREIKFRAWDKDAKTMITAENKKLAVALSLDGRIFVAGMHMGDDLVLMQYTGLRDKNGVEIYEGDVVQDHNGIGVVEFDKWAAFAVTYRSPERFVGRGKWFCDYSLRGERESIEVIGNIWQNPELLEASK